MQKLENKVVIITGASSGIGQALAMEAMDNGMFVVMAARRTNLMEEMALSHQWEKDRYLIVTADVSIEEDCLRIIEKTLEKFGRIDALINNAGVSMRALFADVDLGVIRQLMDINFWGTVYCTKYALPHLLQSGGSVAGVSSIAGFKGLPARTGYSASKFAMHGFLEALRIENLKTGLHVLIVCPGFTASNIRKTALAKDGSSQGESPRDEASMMQPREVAKHIIKAIASRKRTLVLTRQGKLTVLLNKLFPKWTDKLVFGHMAKEPDSPFK